MWLATSAKVSTPFVCSGPRLVGSYRRAFRCYTEDRPLVSVRFYAMVSALFGGSFILRYHLEPIFFAPIALGFLAYYLHLGLRPDSAAKRPEYLHRERAFSCFAVACVIVFVGLMFACVPFLYEWFNIDQADVGPLRTLGSETD